MKSSHVLHKSSVPQCPFLLNLSEPLAVEGGVCRLKLDISRAFVFELLRTRPKPGTVSDGTFSKEQFPKLCMHVATQYRGF